MNRALWCAVILALVPASGSAGLVFGQQSGATTISGGQGGSAFSDTGPQVGARVQEVQIRCGERIDSVQMLITLPDGRSITNPQHGGSGGRLETFRLDPGEYIVGLSGRFGEGIDSLRIHTNIRTSPLYGGGGGDRDYRIDVPSGSQAVGFVGRAGERLDAIGLAFAPLPQTPTGQAVLAGGQGGTEFSDREVAQGARIVEVRVYAGELIDAIQVVYRLSDGRVVEGTRRGGRGGRGQVLRLDSDEYITGISGRCGEQVDSLRIITNKRTSPTFGGRGGSRDFQFSAPSGSQVVGFAGRAGEHLDAIGLTYSQPDRRFGGRYGERFGGRLARQGGTVIGGETIAASPSTCNIPSRSNRCSVTVQGNNPNGKAVQLWARGPLDSQEKSITGVITDTTFSLSFDWVYAGTVVFNLYQVAGNSKTLLATATAVGQKGNPGGETITASPSSCNIPSGSNRCSVTVQGTNPNRRTVQVWARGPLDSQEKSITDIITDTTFRISFDWVYAGTVVFNLYQVVGNSKTLLATGSAVGIR